MHRKTDTTESIIVDKLLAEYNFPEDVKIAGDRIIVMPGCGITERNFKKIHERIGAREYHVHLPMEEASKMEFHPGHIYMGGLLRQSEFTIAHTDERRVKTIRSLI